MIGGDKVSIPLGQISDIGLSFLPRLGNALINEEVVQISLRSGQTLAFSIGGSKGKDFVSSINDLMSNSALSGSADMSGAAVKKLVATHEELSKKCVPNNQSPGNLQYTFTGQFRVAITNSYIFVAPSMNIETSLMIPLQEIEHSSAKQVDMALHDAALEVITKTGPSLALAGSKSQIKHASQVLASIIGSGLNDNPNHEFVQLDDTQLKLNDAHRKLSKKWTDMQVEPGETKQSVEAVVKDTNFEEIERILKTSSGVWRRCKSAWKELVQSIERNSEMQSHLQKMDDFYETADGAIKSALNCDLFESRKGAREVTRSSNSSSSGGGFGAGIRVGGVGIGGGSSSRSGYSSSRTVYNPAPDELTLIETGRISLDKSQLTFIGEQFNKQVQIAKLSHFELDFEFRTMKIVAPGKEKNFYIRFNDFFDFLESAIYLQALLRFKSNGDSSGEMQSLAKEVKQVRDQFLDEQWATARFHSEDISEVLLASNSEHLEKFERWEESIFDQRQELG
jgi:uncharacterized membrane protein YgcG